jgi:hypothetical protein
VAWSAAWSRGHLRPHRRPAHAVAGLHAAGPVAAAVHPFDSLASLYLISALFGLFQGGIVPSYAIIVREYFPAAEAGQRVGAVIMATMFGMALGGWMSGKIFDLTGNYHAAFANGIAWNLLNLRYCGAAAHACARHAFAYRLNRRGVGSVAAFSYAAGSGFFYSVYLIAPCSSFPQGGRPDPGHALAHPQSPGHRAGLRQPAGQRQPQHRAHRAPGRHQLLVHAGGGDLHRFARADLLRHLAAHRAWVGLLVAVSGWKLLNDNSQDSSIPTQVAKTYDEDLPDEEIKARSFYP